jgi:hypothetical protein
MAADECNIRVVARFRPLNDSEERAGSKSIVKFPADQEETLLISVSFIFHINSCLTIGFSREKFMYSIKYFVRMLLKKKSITKPQKKLSKMFLVVIMERYLPMDKHQVEKHIQWR